MLTLPPGGNAATRSATITFALSSPEPSAWERAGVALIPVDDQRKPTGTPSLLTRPEQWNSWFESGANVGCKLTLDHLPEHTMRLLVVVYVYSAAQSLQFMRNIELTVDDSISMSLPVNDMGDSAVIVAEFYRRDAQWKVRALFEGSAYGLMHLGRRIGLDIDDQHPSQPANRGGGRGRDAERCTSATGTGFAVSGSHILTCAHVIRDMRSYRIRSLTGSYDLEVVMVDDANDLALMRVIGCTDLNPVVFKDGPSISLGEPVIAIGYPLASLTGGNVAVTQGGISSLTGLQSNASVLQFTAPIQPGSSGSPLFDMSAQVTGMVTSAVHDAQNMNFAVKSCLALSFLEAAQLSPLRSHTRSVKAAHELVRDVQSALWLVEVRA